MTTPLSGIAHLTDQAWERLLDTPIGVNGSVVTFWRPWCAEVDTGTHLVYVNPDDCSVCSRRIHNCTHQQSMDDALDLLIEKILTRKGDTDEHTKNRDGAPRRPPRGISSRPGHSSTDIVP